ncbi:DUF5801 repeats-in-toxin domain-containing protein, partial [Bradyrhizobium iriomotense]|uniref:DUF5801 repeats-in-toxin domain-containing protein n=1 Tax=Bradyrhizobium iriomotense TaxID=441950 RepID=UPI0024BFD2B4
GHTATSDLLVFTLQVDSDGNVTFTDDRAVKEADGTSPDTNEGISLASGVVTLTATITDNDGDSADSSIDLGKQVTFLDDGPTAHIALNGSPTLIVDETDGVGAAGEFDPVGGNLGTNTILGATLFTNTSVFGADGAAGATPTVYSLSLLSSVSGLTDTATGNAITLFLNGGVIEGHAGTLSTDPLVFTLSINSSTGDTTLTQFRAVVHGTSSDPDSSEAVTLADNAVGVTVTVTDKDGDSSHDTANLNGVVKFLDDGPTASTVTATPVLDDEAQTLFVGNDLPADGVANVKVATGAAGALFAAGADGLQSISFTNPVGLKAIYKDANGLGAQETLNYATTVVAGHTILTATGATSNNVVFKLDVAPDGSYTFTVSEPLVHPTSSPTEENIAVAIGFTVTDGDGDTAAGSLTVNVNDDTPNANTVTATPVLDDDAQTLFVGNPGGTGDVANATIATGAAGALFSAGADGLKSVSFTNPTGLKAIYQDANGLAAQETLHYTTTTAAGGHTIYTAIGDSSGHTVFTLDVGADGSYTFTMSEPLVSPTVGTTEENLSIQIGFTVTDGDNDTATGALTVQVNDDTPGITAGSIQDAILNTVAGSEVHGTWQPVFGADGPNAAAAIAIAIPSTGSGLTYAQTDLGIISGHHVFQIDVSGGTSPYTFYEYSQFNAATQQAEMFAFTDVGLTTSFFTLDVNANGTYDFNLINTSGFEHTVLANASTAKPGNYNPEMFIVGTSFYDGATLPAGTTPDISIDGFDVSGGGHVDENVFVNANGIAVQNGNFEANELMTFHFTGAQTEVQFSLGKFQAGSTSEFTVSLDGGATHTYVISTSSPIIDIKASDFGLTSFHDIDLTKIASALATDDPTVDIETIRYNSVTTLDTTSLNFVLTVTDGDGDQFASTADPLTISLIGGGHTLTGTTGPEVLGATSSIETLNGGTGTNDTIDYEHSTAGVNVNLQTNAVSGGWAAGDTISNFENVIGSAFNDTLTALNTGSILDGGANSAGGTDTLIGGNGNDVLIASRAGVDSLTGGGGNDTFVLHGDGATNVSIADFNASGTDGIVVDVADQALTINTAALINAATQFASGNGAPTTGGVGWTESTSADKFYLNTSDNTLWYSANGTGSDQVLLAHMSTGVAPSAIHVA